MLTSPPTGFLSRVLERSMSWPEDGRDQTGRFKETYEKVLLLSQKIRTWQHDENSLSREPAGRVVMGQTSGFFCVRVSKKINCQGTWPEF